MCRVLVHDALFSEWRVQKAKKRIAVEHQNIINFLKYTTFCKFFTLNSFVNISEIIGFALNRLFLIFG